MSRCIIHSALVLSLIFLSALALNAQKSDIDILHYLPDIPQNISDTTQRADYLALHYWDKIDPLNNVPSLNIIERLFVDYAEVLTLVSGGVRDSSVNILMKKSECNSKFFNDILNTSIRYLYEPASPVCNEETLIPFLQYAVETDVLDETNKIRPRFLLSNVMNNRLGHTANDFTYTLQDETKGTLHDITTEWTVLFFKDPECDECLALTNKLIFSPKINNLLKNSRLSIIAMYVGSDVDVWRAHSGDVLHSWIYARDADETITSARLYDIKQFPSLYLFNKQKQVVLKNTTFEQLEVFIENFN